MRRSVKTAAATLGLVIVIAVGGVAAGALTLGTAPSELPAAAGLVNPNPSASLEPSSSQSPGTSAPASPAATPTPSPTPVPTPVLVPAPMTGRQVTPRVAAQHPIALMIDDAPAARPQSGFNAASVVWQAPAEGGVPRYMLVFQDQMPVDVGPVRSARYYFITWAAEWKAVYGHVGGSPEAMATLRATGNGQLGTTRTSSAGAASYRRITTRRAAQRLLRRQRQIMATSGAENEPMKAARPAWTPAEARRAVGSSASTTRTTRSPTATIAARTPIVAASPACRGRSIRPTASRWRQRTWS
jgi:hypothetical protein